MDNPVSALSEFAGSNATAVRIEPGEDARDLLPHLDRLTLVEIAFPKFRDGRGYTGEMRAAGDVLVDQIAFMKRCGFDSFAPDVPLDPAAAERALSAYADVYQAAADAAVPVWKLRHG
jgi:uncharacterized protein (DUF934 family)